MHDCCGDSQCKHSQCVHKWIAPRWNATGRDVPSDAECDHYRCHCWCDGKCDARVDEYFRPVRFIDREGNKVEVKMCGNSFCKKLQDHSFGAHCTRCLKDVNGICYSCHKNDEGEGEGEFIISCRKCYVYLRENKR